jgi:hypothetical protein
MTPLAAVVSILLTGAAGVAKPAVPGDREVWEVASDSKTVTWLVIHNLAEGKTSGLFHIEVLERQKTEPAWRFKRLAAHMAITQAALRASVRKPLGSGRVYPEQFDQAFARWQAQRDTGGAPICEQTVLACLKSR